MPTIRTDETQVPSVQDTSSEQVVELQPNKGPSAPSQSRLIIELPPDIAADLEDQPDAPPRGINLLLNEVEWDPVREVLLLPSGLELAGIQTANNTTQITLADGTLLIIQGHSENPPSIEIENQILTAQEIQTAFAAARNAEPSAGPEASSGPSSGSEPSSGNNEPQSPLPANEDLTGSGNDFEPIPIAVQPSFPITPLLLPSERSEEFLERDFGDGVFENNEPIISSMDPSDPTVRPAFFEGNTDDVYEAGLASGSNAGQAVTQTAGPMNIQSGSSPLQTLEVCDPTQDIWIDVTNGGQITTPHGTYTITAHPDGTYSWTYTLDTAGDHSNNAQQDMLKVRVTNEEGNKATGDITINIVDDEPLIDITDNPAQVAEGDTLVSTWSLNPGADGVTHITVSVPGEADQTIALSGNTSATFTLPKGTLTVNPDGTYAFEAATNLDNDDPQEQSFTITATDADGDTTTDTQTITITDGTSPTPPDNLPGEAVDLILTVNEAALDTTQDQNDLAAGNITGSDPTSTAETEVSSTLTFTAGSDNLSTFAFGDLSGITITNGDAALNVSWTITNGQLIGSINGTPAIILVLSASEIQAGQQGTVQVTATLTDAFPHDASGEPIKINGITINASDHDGDTVTADIQVNIIDDAPQLDIADTPASVAEGNTLNGTWTLNPGADGVTHITVSVPGEADQTIALSGNTPATFTLPKGTLTVNPDGTYSFEAAGNLDNDEPQEQSFTITATDADGDTTTDTQTITITDGISPTPPDNLPGEAVDLILTVNEAALDTTQDQDDLAAGNITGSDPTSSAETEISSSLTFTAGSDNLSTFAFGDPSGITITNGDAALNVSWTVSNGQLIGSINGTPAIILALNASEIPAGQQGSIQVTATLTDAFPHDASGEPIKINGITIDASDHDGDTVTADIQVNIIDDAPQLDIADTPASVAEGNTLNGTWTLNPGADGVMHITVSVPGEADQTIALSGNTSATFTLPKGTLTVNPDGTYAFEAATNLDNDDPQEQSFTITATDADGDTTTDTQIITITDGTSPTPPDNLPGEVVDLILTVNEAALDTTQDQDDLATGNTSGSDPTSTDETEISSTLTFTAGSDNLSTFAFGDPSGITITNGDAALNVSWTITNGQLVGSINGTPAIILVLNAAEIQAGQQGTVQVTATLTDAFPHDASGEPIKINGITINASDHDGDTVTANIQVNIIDDAPQLDIADTPASVAEGNTLNGTWTLNPGADDVTHITVSVPGEADQTIALSGNTPATFTLPKGTLTVNPDGTYSFEAATNLDNDDPQEQNFTITAMDADGDTTTDTQTITITDGPNPFGGDIIALSLDESALGEQIGNNDPTGDVIGSNPASTAETQSDTLSFTAGSDNIVSFTIGDTSSIEVRDDSGAVVTSLNWTLSADKQTLTGSINGQNVIQLSLTGSTILAGTTGTVQVTATLLAEFPHVTNGTSDFTILGVPIIATDTDGSTALGFTNISIKDDGPDIDIADVQDIVSEGETITDTFSLSSGADGYKQVTVYTDINDQHIVSLAPNTQTTLYTKQGELTIHSDGTWEFTASTGLDFNQPQTLQFFISVEDGDGDTDTDSHLISIKPAAPPILGTSGNDVLTGTQTSELIKGLGGDDTINGGAGRDKIAGMGGKDTLTGGEDSDTFVLDLSNLSVADLITDYKSTGEDADKLDVTELVGTEEITQQNVGDYFQLSGGILSFDQDGAGTNHNMVQVMEFSSPPAQLELIVDENQAPVVVTA
ncbi:hemolysin-type calcium-binding repeat protein [Pseudovibrio sp. FO-BEG1]|uniref:beta strand repeat-containing protein n=1 Tax=Pseudovibrio sp. (strain FO-BEG1) TaxID=911045 RepID=UPI000238CA18|nr:type I secretion protein [Pseudovibrio sp. FO-BEG1]AEV37885.1 hemolysin-type calcium-binding repeat protein [Pseudovibrio sp. FO-BEG1]